MVCMGLLPFSMPFGLLFFALIERLLQEDLLIHGDSVYDIIDKQDHASIQSELMRGLQPETSSSILDNGNEKRIFLCRMNVSRNARRQMRFGDQKVTLMTIGLWSFNIKINDVVNEFWVVLQFE